MSKPNNPIEILRLLPKSNCGECREPTCLAFAAAVFKGQKGLGYCPHLDKASIDDFSSKTEKRMSVDLDSEKAVAELKRRMVTVDLSSAAERVGAGISGDKLTLKVLGKNFTVDSKGNLSSEIHIHPWVAIPILSCVISSDGLDPSGKWVPFRELRSGRTWYGLFSQRCEKPLKKVADTYTDLFQDMLHVFNGKQVENHYASDISLVLSPLPKVPILICYWKPEDGLESSLNIFFDSTAEDNLNVESIFALGTGLVRMFEKIALRHGATMSANQ
jgi:Domain of unknown function (DUF3786)/Putative Fe-S cluster